MKIKSAQETENTLFNRKEVEAIVEADITPKMSEALQLISDKYSMPQDNIKVKGVYGKFGSKEFKVIANVYKTKQDKEKTEVKTKQEKEAEKKAAADAAAAKEAEKKAFEEAAKAKAAEAEAKKKAEEEAKAAKEAEKAEKEAPAEEVKEEDKKE